MIVTSSVYSLYMQNDSFREGPKFITISHENNLPSTVIGRHGGDWVMDDTEGAFQSSGDKSRHDTPCAWTWIVMPQVSSGEGKQLTVSALNIITSVKVCICQVSFQTVIAWFIIINFAPPQGK